MLENKIVFSIIIPTYNRPQPLTNCLQSLADLDYPDNRFEVIVVDDGSKISLKTVVKPLQNQLNLTLIPQANAGPATARNTGAKQAQGKFLAFIDDDCTPANNWLQVLETYLIAHANDLIGGCIINALSENIYATASQALLDYIYASYQNKTKFPQFFTSNNIALSAENFWAIGGFDTNFPLAAAEDREFCDRLLSHNYKMRYAPESIVYHAHHLTLKTFYRQHFNYGRGAFLFHKTYSQRHPQQKSIQSWSFYLKLITYPLTKQYAQAAVLLCFLILLSQIATTFGMVTEKLLSQNIFNSQQINNG
ncbi:MAG: glycosyltransferase [Dolichospermum sp. JUN01]|jgi:glycosyltransferase involved in cell wall biosynthesis|nr:glycosyltransferase [Dolichospermum sp. JUN01]MBS9392725.1 glycosyltransferase [Dolichospermum sp. OL01]MCO5796362.1 glycosyltransferase [Dolichospermum sp. OL03]MCS6279828.1 glycosyltransferase [Dolichospermum sp.]QSV57973.1 MAG: glycosyltransferase [Dolichospermum sp. LBC05a]